MKGLEELLKNSGDKMKLLLILNQHRKKLYEIETVEEIDQLIEEIRNIDESEISKINPNKLKEINDIIKDIFNEIEKKKSEIVKNIQKTEKSLKGLKAYNR